MQQLNNRCTRALNACSTASACLTVNDIDSVA